MRSALLPSEPAFDLSLATRPRGPRVAVCPPHRSGARPWLARLREWLGGSWPREAGDGRAAPTRPDLLSLEAVRREFIDAVDGIRTPGGDELLDRIHFARSLRELWHLRAEVFRLVSLHHSQAEADERLAGLNRHFPTRSPRSGFAPLHGSPTNKAMWP
jgi:hypothetical protein